MRNVILNSRKCYKEIKIVDEGDGSQGDWGYIFEVLVFELSFIKERVSYIKVKGIVCVKVQRQNRIWYV